MQNKHLNYSFIINIFVIILLSIGFGYEFQKASQIERRKEQWKNIIEHANFAFVTVDENGIIEMWSDGAEKLFGWKMSDIIGKNLSILFPNNEYSEIHTNGFNNKILRHKLKLGEILEAKGKLISKNNEEILCRVTVRAISNGHLCYVASITPESSINKLK